MYIDRSSPQLPIPEDMYSLFPRVYEYVCWVPGYRRDTHIKHLLRTFEASDGLFMFTPTSYEPEAVAAAKGWFAEMGHAAYAVGPLLPSASKATAAANERKQSTESSQILEFLDATLKTSGKKSLVYVRPSPSQIVLLLRHLILGQSICRSRSVPSFGL